LHNDDAANGSKQTRLQNTSADGGSDGTPKKHPSNNNVFYGMNVTIFTFLFVSFFWF